MSRSRNRVAALRGFTLLEVMIGLAILGFSLTVLIKSASGSMNTALKAQMMGVATDLSRSKMYDIEEILLKDGFTDTDQSEENKTFEEEGWPKIKYSYKVEQVELPSWESLQEMATERGSADAAGAGSSGSGEDGTSAFQNSALGGMLSQLGGGFGGAGAGAAGIDAKQGASFIQGQYSMVQEVLKVSIRKVTLTVSYQVTGEDQSITTVAFFTDAGAMDKVLAGMGSTDLDDQPGGAAGSGSGSGSAGRGSGSGARPARGSGGR
jgi:prepilin-type N-terminal cleavage/methylation domain-containing protein